ncbi:hypothetical protein [Saccharothrix deserti]|uniref:hypothetical protein n=1 Tax=Saccharothrix deserti TaxID=2593674 RepID=UPI00131E07DF|nr:hypothetical protein [Saccharothrix deserti]
MTEQGRDLVVDRLRRGLRLATLAIAVTTQFAFALPLLVANQEIYLSPAREALAFAILTAVAIAAGVRVLRDRPLGRSRWIMVAAVFTASVLATTGIPAAELMSEAEWSYGVIGWFGLLLLVDHSAVAPAVFLGAHTVVGFAQLILVGQHREVADLVVVTAVVLGCELPVLAAAMALRRLAVTASAAAGRAERVRTADAIAEHLHSDRRSRYADLATTTVPLLTDLTTGSADLGDERVRNAYAVAAARLRRLFAEHDEVVDPLLHELRACVDLAERNGVVVYLGTCGDRPTPPPAVRRALTEPALRIMATATSEARVTVLGSPAGVAVSVVARTDEVVVNEPEPVAADDTGVTVTRLVDGANVWVEATWRTTD